MAIIFEELWTITVKLMDDMTSEQLNPQDPQDSAEAAWGLQNVAKEKSELTFDQALHKGHGAAGPSCCVRLNWLQYLQYWLTWKLLVNFK